MHRDSHCKSNRSSARPLAARLETLGLLIGIPAALLGLALISPHQLDTLPRLCVWSRMLGGPCPACGTVHALCWLLHGSPGEAVNHNWNVVVVAPLVVGIWVAQLRMLWR
jgi:hypothetical protein